LIPLNELQVFLVGKDFGARPAHLFSILHPERVLGVVTLGVPFIPPGPSLFHKLLPEGFYILRWKVLLKMHFLKCISFSYSLL